MKVSLASMIHKPPDDFKYWLDYHFSIGISDIYLRVEDTPEIKDLLDTSYQGRVHPTFVNDVDKTDNWHTKQGRQTEFINKIIKLLPNDDWLLHIDDDELLDVNTTDITKIINILPKRYNCIFIKTVEALYPKVNKGNNCFNTTDKFVDCNSGKYCSSYMGGKSVVRIEPGVQAHGPHRFKGTGWSGDKSPNCFKPEVSFMKIKHYESCSVDRWYKKFSNMKPTKREIPDGFNFYNESINSIKDGSWYQVYKKFKVDPYYKQ
jgi:hypothetical protein